MIENDIHGQKTLESVILPSNPHPQSGMHWEATNAYWSVETRFLSGRQPWVPPWEFGTAQIWPSPRIGCWYQGERPLLRQSLWSIHPHLYNVRLNKTDPA
ncbi:hypothetical protein BaRGS_00005124 [Batillaria attramentaria]|uniref:Uncharacterized protein n=1 Tax=Batillaria attramentaria TaxID=370345 RepID=A0ABD0LV95_9CAEN